MQETSCSHIENVVKLKPREYYLCADCVKIHSGWMHLRTCQTCGITLCCEDSPNQHMTKHFHATGHPVVISAEPGERWLYCYADDAIVGY